jgi:hypothetical protein
VTDSGLVRRTTPPQSRTCARHIAVRELEIPHGPCATFTMEAGQRYAVYQLVRPDAVYLFDGRIDP